MKGLERFVEARMAGELIAKELTLWVGMDASNWWKFGNAPNGRIDSAGEDMRATIGLDVVLVAKQYDNNAARIFNKLQEYAKSIVFVCLNEGDGFVWLKGQEARPL